MEILPQVVVRPARIPDFCGNLHGRNIEGHEEIKNTTPLNHLSFFYGNRTFSEICILHGPPWPCPPPALALASNQSTMLPPLTLSPNILNLKFCVPIIHACLSKTILSEIVARKKGAPTQKHIASNTAQRRCTAFQTAFSNNERKA